jgi:hypothetical protein
VHYASASFIKEKICIDNKTDMGYNKRNELNNSIAKELIHMNYFTVSARGRKGYRFETLGFQYECSADLYNTGNHTTFDVFADNRKDAIKKCEKVIEFAQKGNYLDEVNRQTAYQQISRVEALRGNGKYTDEQINVFLKKVKEAAGIEIVEPNEEPENEAIAIKEEISNEEMTCQVDNKPLDKTFSKSIVDGYDMIYFNCSDANIKRQDLSSNEHDGLVSKNINIFYGIQNKKGDDSYIITFEEIINMAMDDVSFWIKIINTDCYKTDNVLIELDIEYLNKGLTLYLSRDDYHTIIADRISELSFTCHQ